MPKVSVVIPVHNAQRFLRDCLDSVLTQTLDDIEVICVDDGSTDDSLSILRRFAESDSRVSVLSTDQSGAGPARNLGMERAGGDYLAFLDSDDLFEPKMLESAYLRCVADHADICVFRARFTDAETGRVTNADSLLKLGMVPQDMPFSYRDIPDHILNFTSPAPWNKLFDREFVAQQGLRFQDLSRANDFLFTKLALVRARRITVLGDYLVYYRVGAQGTLQANNDKTPLVFHEAHKALKDALVEVGVFEQVERSFVNLVLSNSLYNLHSLRQPDSFDLLYVKLRDEYFEQMGVLGRGEDYFHVRRQFEQLAKIATMTPEEYLLDELGLFREQLKASKASLAEARASLNRMRSSTSFKVGRAMTYLPRRLSQRGSLGREAGS